MKLLRFISALCFLLSAFTAAAQPFADVTLAQPAAASGGSSPTYLVKQGFETPTTGFDNGETWTKVSTQNEADTSGPLVGSQSWSSSTIAAEAWTSFTSSAEVWAFATGKFAVLDNVVEVFEIRDSSGTYVTRVRLLSDGSMRIVNFATSATTSAGLVSAGTQFYMWLRFVKGTGSDSISEIYISSTATKPGSPSASITTGGTTVNAARVAVMAWSGGKYQWDKVRVDDVDIGSDPE